MSDPQIYVACLTAYNAGKLHGAHIDAGFGTLGEGRMQRRGGTRRGKAVQAQKPNPDASSLGMVEITDQAL